MGEQTSIALHVPEGRPDLGIIATGGGGDCQLRLWRLRNSPALVSMGQGHSSTIRSLKFSPDGKQLVSVGEDASVLVWNIFLEEIFPEAFEASAPAPA